MDTETSIQNKQSGNKSGVHGNTAGKTPVSEKPKSGVVGVYWYEKTKKWATGIRRNGRWESLGHFKELEKAIAARKEAVGELRLAKPPTHLNDLLPYMRPVERNMKVLDRNTSGVTGVTWSKKFNKWRASIQVAKRRIHLGYFKEKEGAVAARKKAEEYLGGAPRSGIDTKYHTEAERKAALKVWCRQSYERNKEKVFARTRKWRAENPELAHEYGISVHQRHIEKDPINYFLAHLKRSARRRGLEFNLEPSDIIIPELCPVFGIPIYFLRTMTGGPLPDSASADRVDSHKGYLKGNIQIISQEANWLKRNCNEPWKFRAIADYIERNLRQGCLLPSS